jgi:DNA polymerase (family 10)
MFKRMGDALEFKGENPFKVNAYRKASRVISNLTEDIEQIWNMGNLRMIPGVGEGIAKKIDEYLRTGRMTKYEEITKDVPGDVIDMIGISGLGPRTLALAYKELGVRSLQDLKDRIKDGSLAELPGLGAKKVENIQKGIRRFEEAKGRILLGVAFPTIEGVIEELKTRVRIAQIAPCGSLRRMKESVGDLDILTAGGDRRRIIQCFTGLPQVKDVMASGDTKASIVTNEGVQIDLRVVEEDSFGAALQYFTGSKSHNIRLRELAKRRGLKINEYGVFRGGERVGGRDEEDVYAALGMTWVPPEVREDQGEVEAGLEGRMPSLITYEDIKGDLHVHSRYSDGTSTIREIAERAKALGYTYIAICDHSQTVRYAGGLTESELLRQIEEIRRVNEEIEGVRVLAGAEVDILQDGNLDYPDKILSQLDIVVAAIHTGFKRDVTKRFIQAMQHPNVHIIAHPTGRLISSREGYDVDIDRVIEVASETSTALEVNAYYDRLDLNDVNCRKAVEAGVKLAIGTDAHHLDQLWMLRLGTGVVRRGWAKRQDVLNTYNVCDLLEHLRSR